MLIVFLHVLVQLRVDLMMIPVIWFHNDAITSKTSLTFEGTHTSRKQFLVCLYTDSGSRWVERYGGGERGVSSQLANPIKQLQSTHSFPQLMNFLRGM